MRFRLRTLMMAVTVAAAICSLPVACRRFYFHERIAIHELLSEYPQVENIVPMGFGEFPAEEIVVTQFSLRDRPDAVFRVGGLEDASNGQLGHLRLNQIGSLRFVVTGTLELARGASLGQPTRTQYWRGDVDIGPESEFAMVLPFTVSTVDELLENYDELCDYFKTWPTSENPGRLTASDGSEIRYYVKSSP